MHILYPLSHDAPGPAPSKEMRERMGLTLTLFQENEYDIVVLSGGRVIRNYPEASVFKNMLVGHGVDASTFRIDEIALDTVGQFVFPRLEFYELLEAERVDVVTHDWHAERVKLIIAFVYPEQYERFHIHSVQSAPSDEILKHERDSMDAFRRTMTGVTPGDIDAIVGSLHAHHQKYKF